MDVGIFHNSHLWLAFSEMRLPFIYNFTACAAPSVAAYSASTNNLCDCIPDY
jgi:hypothetical protein